MRSLLLIVYTAPFGMKMAEEDISFAFVTQSRLPRVREGLGVLSLIVSIALLVFTGCDTGTNILNYNKISFNERSGSVRSVLAFSSASQPLFFRLKSSPETVYDIDTISVMDAERIGRKNDRVPNYYSIGNSGSVQFKTGNRQTISITGGEIEFATSRDGEFISLPVKKSTILRLFGKPISIERPHPAWR